MWIQNKINLLVILLLLSLITYAQNWTLQQCVDTALSRNKSLLISRNNIAISKEKHEEAYANLIPKVNLNADYKYYTDLPTQLMPLSTFDPLAPEGKYKEAQFGVPHNFNGNIQVLIPLYNSQIYGAIKATEIASELTGLQLQKSEEQVVLEVSNLYYNIQILYKQLLFIDTNIVHTEKLLERVRLLKEQQMIKGTDVTKVELQLSQLQTQRSTIENKITQVTNALKFNLGISLESKINVQNELTYKLENQKESNSTTEQAIANTQFKLTKVELKNAKRSLLPTLSFIGSYGTMGYGYDKKPNNFLNFYPIGLAGVQFTYPLFSGTVVLHKINQKKLELKNSGLQQEMISDQLKMQKENLQMQISVAIKSISNTEEQIAQAKKIYNQTILLHGQGLSTLNDVFMADTELRQAQQNNVSAIVDYLKAELELKRLNGNIIKRK